MSSLWRRWRRIVAPEEAALDDAIDDRRAVRGGQGAVRELFAEIAAADLEAFERVRENRWVAPFRDEGDFRVLEIQALKGLRYTVAWGVSLSYVPHDTPSGPRFHRTAKAARIDLGQLGSWHGDPPCSVNWRTRMEDGAVRGYWIPTEVAEMWRCSRPKAEMFWERTAAPAGVRATALEQRGQIHLGPMPDDVARYAAERMAGPPTARA